MSQVEYLVALISIIVGLGLTDLAQSVRELIRPDHTVKWDGLPLAWSAFVFLVTILLWWQGFNNLKDPTLGEGAGPMFLMSLLFFLLIYLCCAFALPDPDWKGMPSETEPSGPTESSEAEVNLEAFYFSAVRKRWFFGLLIGFWIGVGVLNQLATESAGALQRLALALPTAGMVALTAVPIATDRRWAHWVAVVILGGFIGAVAVRDILL